MYVACKSDAGHRCLIFLGAISLLFHVSGIVLAGYSHATSVIKVPCRLLNDIASEFPTVAVRNAVDDVHAQ
eukprot:2464840-Pyramimonas_sp.AAC.1